MAIKDIENIHKPDILSCLANLSSDEVLTPPNIANDMLNLLPEELFKSPDTKFLDPCCKSGVFLREIAKRLINGLRDKFPTLEECLEHIFKKQLFGISITELTGLLSRRSLYCSRNASGEFSIVHFDNEQGNIRFNRIEHKWNQGRCKVCGAPKSAYDRAEILETHAYEFIHMNEDKIEELTNMQFDVVIGNPPYHISDGGGNGKSAKPIYQFFINRAKELNPKYITMIIPARWYIGGKGLDEFRLQMLTDKRVRILDDFPITSDCFFEVTVKGGVCYFRWDRDDEGKCKISRHENGHLSSSVERYLFEEGYNVLIRYSEAIPILKKIRKFQEKTFDTIVRSRRPFGLNSNFKDFCNTYLKIHARCTPIRLLDT